MENKTGAAMLIYPNYLAQKRDKETFVSKFKSLLRGIGAYSDWDEYNGNPGYVVANGVAIVPVMGAMMKGWGYPDQSELRGLMQNLKSDVSVKGVLNVFDTPGGSVAGTADYGSSVADLAAAKPCFAYCEDMCASAGYWAASNCGKIFANSTALVGSIGVISWLTDASKMYEENGIKDIPITTGKFKAAGDPSQPATQEVIDYMQETIDAIYGEFLNVVSTGRGISKTKIKEMEAKVFMGQEAVNQGLVDKICSLDEAFNSVVRATAKTGKSNKAMLALCDLELSQL